MPKTRRLPPHLARRAARPPQTPAPPPGPAWRAGHYDGPTDPDAQIRHARYLATCIMPPLYRDDPARCLSLIMKAQALDIPRATAAENIYWNLAIGKGAVTAQLMASLLDRHGYGFHVTTETDQRVAMTFHRVVNGRRRRLGDVEWTILEAIGAGLTWRHTWQHHPKDMLWARCLMRGARRYASKVATGLAYTDEEVTDMSAPAEGSEVHTAVADLLARAADPATTSDEIRTTLVDDARRRRLLDCDTGDGRPLGYTLGMLWGVARAREATAHTANTEPVVAGPTAELAGHGILPCRCRASTVLAPHGRHDPEVCTRA